MTPIESTVEALAVMVAVVVIIITALGPVLIGRLRLVEDARLSYLHARNEEIVARLLQSAYAVYRTSKLQPSYIPPNATPEVIAERRHNDVVRAVYVHNRSLEIGSLLIRLQSTDISQLKLVFEDLYNEVSLDENGEWCGYLRLYLRLLLDQKIESAEHREILDRLFEACRAVEPNLKLLDVGHDRYREVANGAIAIVVFFAGIGMFALLTRLV